MLFLLFIPTISCGQVSTLPFSISSSFVAVGFVPSESISAVLVSTAWQFNVAANHFFCRLNIPLDSFTLIPYGRSIWLYLLYLLWIHRYKTVTLLVMMIIYICMNIFNTICFASRLCFGRSNWSLKCHSCRVFYEMARNLSHIGVCWTLCFSLLLCIFDMIKHNNKYYVLVLTPTISTHHIWKRKRKTHATGDITQPPMSQIWSKLSNFVEQHL